ncbi:hypothetical protein ME1_01456 [Bartonella vinsonii subsp. arupensis OK-94-513]|uniref:Uncharacterized protein n=1 Tax=Bartonella vinsonii subsp. arupensis OK-94-513 TaxID=1094562 RepID=J0QS32_BARVI|nr:hypothetical protein [Bartonella vinsonii]EJF85879.1 hypothetical protein ME1_01456 [Bartonella vinsonii subsp. arupensis OK-94-513]
MVQQKNNDEAEFLITAFVRVTTNTNIHYDSVHYEKSPKHPMTITSTLSLLQPPLKEFLKKAALREMFLLKKINNKKRDIKETLHTHMKKATCVQTMRTNCQFFCQKNDKKTIKPLIQPAAPIRRFRVEGLNLFSKRLGISKEYAKGEFIHVAFSTLIHHPPPYLRNKKDVGAKLPV